MMLNPGHSEALLNQLQYLASKENDLLVEKQEYNLFQMLKPKLYRDGNQWCVLYGDNLQEGICGFGDSPYKAIWNWKQAFDEPIKA